MVFLQPGVNTRSIECPLFLLQHNHLHHCCQSPGAQTHLGEGLSGSSPPAPLSVFFRNFSNLAWRPFKSRKRFSRRTAWRREEDTEGQHLSQRWSWRAENRACCSESWPSLSQYPDTPQEDTEHKTGTTCSAPVQESRPTS